MKPLKLGLRVWFTITSLVSFLAGWMLLSHAGKPAALIPNTNTGSSSSTTSDTSAQFAPIPTLPPVPSLSQLTTNNSSNNSATTIQSLPSLPSTTTNNFFPTFRGRGS